MKNILFFARDPGGVNALIPVILNLKSEYNIFVYGKDNAIERFRQNGIVCRDITREVMPINIDNISNFFSTFLIDLIVTGTSSDDFTEKYIWKAANGLKIKSFAIVDSWVNYGIRFSKYSTKEMEKYWVEKDFSYFPDYILIMDKFSKEKMIEEGIPKNKIYITGQPHLEYTRNRILNVNKESVNDYKRKMGCVDGQKIIVYASDNIYQDFDENNNDSYWGYNERTIFINLNNALNSIKFNEENYMLLIRPHPKENIEYWKKIALNNNKVKVVIDATSSSDLIIKSADLIISMQSMFLIEAALVGKSILSIQIGLKREDPLILSRLGIIKTIVKEEQLRQWLSEYFEHGQDFEVTWDIGKNAIRNVRNLIKETSYEKSSIN